ncbi:RNA polymerase-associated protein RapA [Methylocaldum szegediense]|uniref:RNA polymerase-associated protein RapA n=1 Tax=Methylocaldum szegediense TaxID=73780 RepID=A0ABM9I732_9GAMM|nr:RNA polymerase-associated protein RapA [Methylocaldum szegediense]CAI8934462.1 RNA polymerase-associated protein RapA [Methylocaldum szegediense]
MPIFVPGQRWISETEPELGLGIVLSVENNRVTLLFIASSERRTYAVNNAPLTRVRFSKGDLIESADGWKLKVTEVKEQNGLITYEGVDEDGTPRTLEEVELNHFMQFNRPQDRLFTGQLDPSELFRLRYETLQKIGQLEQSPVRGLIGGRTSIIPHQIYIAHEVAHRPSPRVLLADEVGLGKTIEAGLIIHHQLLTGRAERVLIIVPEPLLHQWLVEMLRRFNLRFALFDDERYWQFEHGNPFLSEQLVLCGLDFFMDDEERQEAALAAGWDMCVVDEAHHLQWSEQNASPEYQFVERLGRSVPSLLLLTATPEQLGKRSHFARLRLLDPDRFYSYDRFQLEEMQYESLADVVNHLLDDPILDRETLSQLKSLIAHDLAEDLLNRLDDPERAESARAELIQLLLDRHGTGRVLFRNTRATVKGFPGRELITHPLPIPEAYRRLLAETQPEIEDLLHPETLYARHAKEDTPEWWRLDSRVEWLAKTIKSLRSAKVLVICAKPQTAIDLEEALRIRGIRAAVFHEKMSIVARDRAAAWFADAENGAQALVCSEIGSEGRNFQFAHHLVVFDLPLNPDLLEQRIGRLDRIGQTETIRIHVAYFEDGAQGVLFRWYDQGLNAFSQPSPAALPVFNRLGSELAALLRVPNAEEEIRLIERARKLAHAIEEELHQGRDRLLELNSCRKDAAERLVRLIEATDRENDLWPYLEDVFDAYGVAVEEHSDHCYILRPGEHMRTQFPELPEDGVTVTLDRGIGLAREDMQFLTWEHPMVRGAMDLILNSEHGNAAMSLVRHPELETGQLLLETVYVLECAAPKRLQIGRFFPPTVLRFLFDQDGNDLSALPFESLVEQPRQFDREQALELVRSRQKLINRLIQNAEKKARARMPSVISDSTKRMLDTMTTELKRLAALRRVNPNVRQEELDQLKEQAIEMSNCIQGAHLRLDSVRLLVAV